MLRAAITSKIHNWVNRVGFELNSSAMDERDLLTEHYFFETFNFLKESKKDVPEKAEFVCFDTYGEKMNINSLVEFQEAFFENLSILK